MGINNLFLYEHFNLSLFLWKFDLYSFYQSNIFPLAVNLTVLALNLPWPFFFFFSWFQSSEIRLKFQHKKMALILRLPSYLLTFTVCACMCVCAHMCVCKVFGKLLSSLAFTGCVNMCFQRKQRTEHRNGLHSYIKPVALEIKYC